MIDIALRGSKRYWGWIAFLLAITGVGVAVYIVQWNVGLTITGMSRDVSWGLYIANLTFFVGVAASAVMLVIPYYLHNQKEFGKITILGEFLAVAAVIICMLSVIVDLGQPTRMLNLILHPSPNSILFWDILVLSGYLLLNIVIGWMILDAENKGEPARPWVKPLIYISIPWAISIHTVTAFIYSGIAGRPFWLTALMAPRFLASAFASGPALLILLILILRKFTNFDAGKEAIQKIAKIVTYAIITMVFFILLEFFTVYYSGSPHHMIHFHYLWFGAEGASVLVPWIWTSFGLACLAIILLVNPKTRKNEGILAIACASIFVAMWIDKGLGLVVPGFIPSQATGEYFEYMPTLPEWLIQFGVYALGALILTLLYKIAITVKENSVSSSH